NMGIFSQSPDEPRQNPRKTINGGRPNPHELPDTPPRRARLFSECARRLSGHQLASEQAYGVPIGDGAGLEELVSGIAPVFARERSLIRWVALRGAITHLYIHTWDESSRSVPFFPVVETAMGVGHLSQPGDPEAKLGVSP